MRDTDKAPDAFRTISEVAEELDLPQHVLRFWETRFAQIKPVKRAGGRRFYRPDDVDLLRGIRHLLYSNGYTIKGVQRILKEQGIRHVQDLGVEQAAAVMRSDVRPASPAPDREEGTTFGGLLGLLPRRKARPSEDEILPALPPTAELPLPFPDAEADRDLMDARVPEDPLPLRHPRPAAEPEFRHGAQAHEPAARRPAEAPAARRAPRGRGGEEALSGGHPHRERIDPTFAPPAPPSGDPRDDADLGAAPEAWMNDEAPELPPASHLRGAQQGAGGWRPPPPQVRPPAEPEAQSRARVPQRPPSRGPAARVAPPPVAEEPWAEQQEIWPEPEQGFQRDYPGAVPHQPAPFPPMPAEPAHQWEDPQAHGAQRGGRPVAEPPRPTRGPAAQPMHPAASPELDDPLLPFLDQDVPDSGAVSEPIEERIRRLKARVEGPPPEFIPARARQHAAAPPQPPYPPYPPMAVPGEWPGAGDEGGAMPSPHREPAPPQSRRAMLQRARDAVPLPPEALPLSPAQADPFQADAFQAGSWDDAAGTVGFGYSPDPRDSRAPYPVNGPHPPRTGQGGAHLPAQPYAPEASRLPPTPDVVAMPANVRWQSGGWEPETAPPPPPRPDPRTVASEPIPGWLRASAPHAASPARAFDAARDPEAAMAAPADAIRQDASRHGPPDQYLPPHLRADPRGGGQPPMAAPVLSRDDVYRLQAALYELGECRRLMEDALGAEQAGSG